MAKVIEFYVPKKFRKSLTWAPQVQCGKVIEFCLQTKNQPSCDRALELIRERANEA